MDIAETIRRLMDLKEDVDSILAGLRQHIRQEPDIGKRAALHRICQILTDQAHAMQHGFAHLATAAKRSATGKLADVGDLLNQITSSAPANDVNKQVLERSAATIAKIKTEMAATT